MFCFVMQSKLTSLGNNLLLCFTVVWTDGIILGTTSLKQTKEDLDAYLGGPLDAGR